MIRLLQALLTGAFFTMILDFLTLLAIKLHYLERYGISEYYNTFFAEHQNPYLLLALTLLLGVVAVYVRSQKLTVTLYGLFFIPVLLLLIPSFGETAGKALLQRDNVRFSDGRHVYYGTLFYEGRHQVTLFDDELGRLITLDKKDLKP
ncbi:MAG: hypothetical protein JXK05_13970 [Campylobacterales bacterium]|nr:hypothetical protein [Campylobacterales bacterium]